MRLRFLTILVGILLVFGMSLNSFAGVYNFNILGKSYNASNVTYMQVPFMTYYNGDEKFDNSQSENVFSMDIDYKGVISVIALAKSENQEVALYNVDTTEAKLVASSNSRSKNFFQVTFFIKQPGQYALVYKNSDTQNNKAEFVKIDFFPIVTNRTDCSPAISIGDNSNDGCQIGWEKAMSYRYLPDALDVAKAQFYRESQDSPIAENIKLGRVLIDNALTSFADGVYTDEGDLSNLVIANANQFIKNEAAFSDSLATQNVSAVIDHTIAIATLLTKPYDPMSWYSATQTLIGDVGTLSELSFRTYTLREAQRKWNDSWVAIRVVHDLFQNFNGNVKDLVNAKGIGSTDIMDILQYYFNHENDFKLLFPDPFDVDDAYNIFNRLVYGLADQAELYKYGYLKYTDVDGDGISNIDEVANGTDPNVPNPRPIASFTLNKSSAKVGETITATSNSTDEDGDTLIYTWTLSKPIGSNATLSYNGDKTKVSFTPDTEGAYIINLSVYDGYKQSDPFEKKIDVSPKPVAGHNIQLNIYNAPFTVKPNRQYCVDMTVRNKGKFDENVYAKLYVYGNGVYYESKEKSLGVLKKGYSNTYDNILCYTMPSNLKEGYYTFRSTVYSKKGDEDWSDNTKIVSARYGKEVKIYSSAYKYKFYSSQYDSVLDINGWANGGEGGWGWYHISTSNGNYDVAFYGNSQKDYFFIKKNGSLIASDKEVYMGDVHAFDDGNLLVGVEFYNKDWAGINVAWPVNNVTISPDEASIEVGKSKIFKVDIGEEGGGKSVHYYKYRSGSTRFNLNDKSLENSLYIDKTVKSYGHELEIKPLKSGEYNFVIDLDNQNGNNDYYVVGKVIAYNPPKDSDNDGVPDKYDAFPNDPAASVDSDGDRHPDFWNKGKTQADSTTGLTLDYYPNDKNKWSRPPNTPSTPSGPTSGYTGKSYSFAASATDPDGDSVTYRFDWGDGPVSDWGSGAQSHSWNKAGNFCVKVQAEDNHGSTSNWSGCRYISVTKQNQNNPPNTPSTPSGPTSGYSGKSYSFAASTTDPNGDSVTYRFDWGDGLVSNWSPGTQSHSWNYITGNFCVKVQAKDSHGATSGWSGCHYIKISNLCYHLSTSVGESGKGSISKNPDKSCYNGDSVTLTATPSSGYSFSGWGGDCSSCGSSTNCTVTVSSDKSCTANFKQIKNNPPIIDSFAAKPTSGDAPLTVTFTCQAHDKDGYIAEYDINYGDSYSDTNDSGSFTHIYNNVDNYTATCTVKDNDGNAVSDSTTINVHPQQQTKSYILHYTFDSCSAYDSTENGNDGEIQGSPQCVNGVSDGALSFDGANDWIKVNKLLSFKDFTISMWFKTSSNQTQGLLQTNDGKESGEPGIGIVLMNGNDLEAGYIIKHDGNICDIHANNLNLSDGVWHLVTLTRDTSLSKGYLYIDGNMIGSCQDPNPNESMSFSSYMSIGKSYYYTIGNSFFKGDLDDVRIYNYALSSDDIKNIYQSLKPKPQNSPPVIDSFTANPTSGDAPLTVTFTCKASDSDGEITNYLWDFDGDGVTDQKTTTGHTSHTYSKIGLYHATVKIKDSNDNVVSSSPKTITVGKEPIISLGKRIGSPGSTVSIPVTFDNNNSIVSLQFNVVFSSKNLSSENIENTIQLSNTLKNKGFSVYPSAISPGNIKIVISPSLQNSSVIIPNGDILTLPIHIKSNAAQGNEIVQIENIVGTDANSNSVNVKPISGTITIGQTNPGDANGDGRINVQDLVSVINDILGEQHAQGNADCNGDGRINVQDVVCLINKILSAP